MKMDTSRTASTTAHTESLGTYSPDAPKRQPASTPQGKVRNNRAKKRRWVPYLILVILLVLITLGFWPKPVPVETAQVTRGVVEASVNEEGKTRLTQRFVVSAPINGQLRRIPFKAGAIVKQNETVVAVIDPLAPTILDERTRALAEARRGTALANLDRARAAQRFAASELQRVQALFEAKTVSIQDYENVQWREINASKEVAAAESALAEAEAQLAEFTEGGSPASRTPVEIKAPASGQILRVLEESSRAVTTGTPLLEIGNPKDLEVIIEVLSRDGAAIKPGAKVELHQWGGPKPLEAVVRLVEPSAFTKISALGVEEQRVYVVADIVTPPEQRLGLGDAFRVEARIITEAATNALTVPSGALFRREGGWSVFSVQNGRAQLKKVEVGLASGPQTQITSGLQENESVILYPGDRIRNNQRVKMINLN